MMRYMTFGGFVAIVSLIFLTGCSGETPRKDKEASTRRYEIMGKVVSVDQKKPALRIDHEDIPGLMKAMEMEFDVEDARILDGIKPGDQVKGELVKEKSGYLITRLEKR
jgi:Cu/Ag efflux protein CusF